MQARGGARRGNYLRGLSAAKWLERAARVTMRVKPPLLEKRLTRLQKTQMKLVVFKGDTSILMHGLSSY